MPFWDETPLPDYSPLPPAMLDADGTCARCGYTVRDGVERLRQIRIGNEAIPVDLSGIRCPDCFVWYGSGVIPSLNHPALETPMTLTENDQKHPGWIGVDFDGTLAHYEHWEGPDVLGAPIPAMVERVKRWLAEGRDVRIFTARVSVVRQPPTDAGRAEEVRQHGSAAISRTAIEAWCEKHLGRKLPITCVKDLEMRELYDDRAVAVEMNTGRLLSPSTRGLPE